MLSAEKLLIMSNKKVSFSRPIKVLHLISSRGLYGAERVIINLIAATDRSRVIPLLGLLQPKGCLLQEFVKAVRETTSVVHVIPCEKWIDRETIQTLILLIRKESVDIVHCHGMKGRLYGLIIATRTNIKLITTHHNWTGSDFRVSLFEIFDACYIRLFQKIIAVSPEVREMMLKLFIQDRKIQVIVNGIDENQFQKSEIKRRKIRGQFGINDDVTFIGTCGRISTEKGQKYFIEAVSHVVKTTNEVQFIIVGDGPQKSEMREYADMLGVSNKIIFAGFQSDVLSFYSALDIFILPSITEGTPMVLLEAMSCGLPVVATKVGGVVHIINNNEDGILVCPKESIELSSAIITLLKDKEYAKHLSAKAMDRIKKYFSIKKMANEYMELYLNFFRS
ncbi:glycosyltransferase family 4 protein [Desulfobulbus sp. F3]|nr:glycosyltransferase family 4 protein [Desulfobulbus sp. F3]